MKKGKQLPVPIRTLVLVALESAPGTGAGVSSYLAHVSEGAIVLSPGALYPAISKLLVEGLLKEVPEDGDRRARRYRLTKDGEKELNETRNLTGKLLNLNK